MSSAASICAALLAAAPPPAAPVEANLPWWYAAAESQSAHYRVKSDLPQGQTAAIARHLDMVHEEFAARLWSLPPRAPAPMNVLLFAREEDYLGTLRMRFGIEADGTGGMFFARPEGRALAIWVGDLGQRRLEHALQHEAFHQYANSRFGTDLPPWVEEGLAEIFGQAIIRGTGSFVGRAGERAVDCVQSCIREGTAVPFAEMLAMTPAAWSEAARGEDASRLYDQAWSMVLFVLQGEGGRRAGAFEKYLRLVNAGHDSASAFARAFEGEAAGALEDGWKRYAIAMEPDGFATAVERMDFLAEGALDLARRGQSPGSLAELREALESAGFTTSSPGHGPALGLRATGETFEIPWPGSDSLRQRPRFIVSPPAKLNGPPEGAAAPPRIETAFLQPRDLAVSWIPDSDGWLIGYEIDVRPPQR
jgi:hypothetical protein